MVPLKSLKCVKLTWKSLRHYASYADTYEWFINMSKHLNFFEVIGFVPSCAILYKKDVVC